ncbi:MAG: hypothetical protein JWQ07_4945 [Ramlibacter sp.]|nr:hypothetical protein [Ramlibacter sp.]
MHRVDVELEKWRKLNARLTRAHTRLNDALKRGAPKEEAAVIRAEVAVLQEACNATLNAVQAALEAMKAAP